MADIAPNSIPPVASATRCEEIRLSSMSITRTTVARGGMSSVMSSSFSTQAVRRFVEERREIVHPGDEGDALRPVAVFQVLLDAGVQIADAATGFGDDLALDLQDQPQHPVGRWMLGTHVDHDAFAGVLAGRGHHVVPVLSADHHDGDSVLISCRTSADRAAESARRGTRREYRPADSPCAGDGRPSRRASRSGSTPDARRTRCRRSRRSRARASRWWDRPE